MKTYRTMQNVCSKFILTDKNVCSILGLQQEMEIIA